MNWRPLSSVHPSSQVLPYLVYSTCRRRRLTIHGKGKEVWYKRVNLMHFFTNPLYKILFSNHKIWYISQKGTRNLAIWREARTIGSNFRFKSYRCPKTMFKFIFVLGNGWLIVFFTTGSKKFYSDGHLQNFLSKELKKSITCSALSAFEQGEVSMVLHLLWHSASDCHP